MQLPKIVARYASGKIIKGYTNNFSPNRPLFNVYPIHADTTQAGIRVLLKELKALFFVRDFVGNPKYDENKEINLPMQYNGIIVEVEFKDGEVLIGTTAGYNLNSSGFFLFPLDPKSNNIKLFVVVASVREVKKVPSFTLKF